MSGTISVNKIPSNNCLDKGSQDFFCYEEYYEDLTENEGVTVAFADLKERYPKSPYVQSQCHPITHVIGRAATRIYKTVSEAYSYGDSYCWSGYYHGILEGVLGKIGRKNLLSQLNQICTDVPGKAEYGFNYYNCVHGLGHGLMTITNGELFESLTLCDSLVGEWEQKSCYSGAFMENIIVDGKNHFTKYLKSTEPLYPCNAVGDKYKGTCYLMQTSYMLEATRENFPKVFELCSQVEDTFRPICYQSLGRDASGRSISNVVITNYTCNLGLNYEQKSNCVIGAVKDFISYHHSDVQAKELCNSFTAELREVCLYDRELL